MAGIVIADTGPLIAFASIDRLCVLKDLFGELTITQSVRDEYNAKPGTDTLRIDAAVTDAWLRVVAFTAELLSPSLGQGESDSIQLAMEWPRNSLLILDDRLARRYALRAELNIVGSVRLLHIAQQRGLIPDAESCLREMAEIGYRKIYWIESALRMMWISMACLGSADERFVKNSTTG